MENPDFKRIDGQALRQFCVRALMACGCSQKQADVTADLLVSADERGVHSHGVNRLEIYTQDLQLGAADGSAEPEIVSETAAAACVNGKNAMGAYVGTFCMDLAIQKAREQGIGFVVARGSNHYGMAGFWAMKAQKEGMIGMSMTNSSPCMVPTGASRAAIGTNPIACAAPAHEDGMVLDMATTTVPLGKIEFYHRQGKPIASGWGVDNTGTVTTDSEKILFGGGLCPLGGEAATGGYKGYGLAMMVDTLCGVLSGAAFGPTIKGWRAGRTSANVGQMFMAINPDKFCPGFEDRMHEFNSLMRGLPLAQGATEVLVPGDPEKRKTDEAREKGVPLHTNVVEALNKIADSLQVERLQL